MCKQDVQPEKDAEMSENVELHFSGGWAFFCLEINILGAAPLVGNMESRYRLGKWDVNVEREKDWGINMRGKNQHRKYGSIKDTWALSWVPIQCAQVWERLLSTFYPIQTTWCLCYPATSYLVWSTNKQIHWNSCLQSLNPTVLTKVWTALRQMNVYWFIRGKNGLGLSILFYFLLPLWDCAGFVP